jgi:uridine phosphorylase
MQPVILKNKHYDAPSVFTAANLLREARRQKQVPEVRIPPICILDPDGDIAHHLIATGQAVRLHGWACYHTKLYAFTRDGIEYGIVPHVVGASFAVLVAEELYASGCQLLISMTSAGQIVSLGQPPYFVLIERALRDEGTSYHYLPPSDYSILQTDLLLALRGAFDNADVDVRCGSTWTTDAPFRETEEAITFAASQGILGVEMEAAALYALAQAKGFAVVCFAHITNQMAQVDGDFDKGRDWGSHDALGDQTDSYTMGKGCISVWWKVSDGQVEQALVAAHDDGAQGKHGLRSSTTPAHAGTTETRLDLLGGALNHATANRPARFPLLEVVHALAVGGEVAGNALESLLQGRCLRRGLRRIL